MLKRGCHDLRGTGVSAIFIRTLTKRLVLRFVKCRKDRGLVYLATLLSNDGHSTLRSSSCQWPRSPLGGPRSPACRAPSPTDRWPTVWSFRLNSPDLIADQRGSIFTCALKVQWNLGPPITFLHQWSRFHHMSEGPLSRLLVDMRWTLGRSIPSSSMDHIIAGGPSPQLVEHLLIANGFRLDPRYFFTATQVFLHGQRGLHQGLSPLISSDGWPRHLVFFPSSDFTWARFRSTTQASVGIGLRNSARAFANIHIDSSSAAWQTKYSCWICRGFL